MDQDFCGRLLYHKSQQVVIDRRAEIQLITHAMCS